MRLPIILAVVFSLSGIDFCFADRTFRVVRHVAVSHPALVQAWMSDPPERWLGWEDAIELLAAVSSFDSDGYEVPVLLRPEDGVSGRIRLMLLDLNAASLQTVAERIDLYRHAASVESDPIVRSRVHGRIASLLASAGDRRGWQASIRSALADDPANPWAAEAAWRMLAEVGDSAADAALAHWLAVNPIGPEPAFAAARRLLAAGRRGMAAALVHRTRILTVTGRPAGDRTVAALIVAEAGLHWAVGRDEEAGALAEWIRASGISELPEAAVLLAWMAHEAGDVKKTVTHLRVAAAVERTAWSVAALHPREGMRDSGGRSPAVIGWNCLARGEREAAKRAFASRPDDAACLLGLSETASDAAERRVHLERAAASGPFEPAGWVAARRLRGLPLPPIDPGNPLGSLPAELASSPEPGGLIGLSLEVHGSSTFPEPVRIRIRLTNRTSLPLDHTGVVVPEAVLLQPSLKLASGATHPGVPRWVVVAGEPRLEPGRGVTREVLLDPDILAAEAGLDPRTLTEVSFAAIADPIEITDGRLVPGPAGDLAFTDAVAVSIPGETNAVVTAARVLAEDPLRDDSGEIKNAVSRLAWMLGDAEHAGAAADALGGRWPDLTDEVRRAAAGYLRPPVGMAAEAMVRRMALDPDSEVRRLVAMLGTRGATDPLLRERLFAETDPGVRRVLAALASAVDSPP